MHNPIDGKHPSRAALTTALRERLTASDTPAAALERRLRSRLRALRDGAQADPFSNPFLLAALEVSRLLDQGEIRPDHLFKLVDRLAVRCFADRADGLAAYLGQLDIAENEAAIADLVRRLAGDPPVAFEDFRKKIELPSLGIVLTAHPTFGMSVELARTLMALASGMTPAGSPLGADATAASLDEVMTADQMPPASLTLQVEHAWSIEALNHLQAALDRTIAIVLEVASDLYPDRWTELVPCLATGASWVGYDLDGRSDIAWTDTMSKRIEVKRAQISRHLARITLMAAQQAEVAAALEPAEAALQTASQSAGEQLAAIDAVARDPQRAGQLASTFMGTRASGLVSTRELQATVMTAVAAAKSPALKRDLVGFRAALATHGLGLAHTHVRLNATQLHNAIRKQVGMETAPNDPTHRRSYVAAITELLGRVKPVTINFAALMAERTTAKRLFMIVQQVVKYVDAEAPVRFLIAETEAGFTLLTALYFARLFGVADSVEISPLFETAEAIEHGDAILDEALRSPDYRDYVRRLGRLAVQFGFSDSGRYLGQMAATFMIERLRLRLAPVMERHGLGDVQLILFNTHGDSIGRGGHPASLADRFRYLAPPVTRADFAGRGIAAKEEVSFQGGDGFMPLMGVQAALAVLRTGLESTLLPDPEAVHDPVYGEGNYAVEFFAAIRVAFGALVDDPNYATLLGAFGANLSPRTGSRPMRRQHEGALRAMDLAHVSQLRAIPNNTILQQLGLMANTLHGVGIARSRDPELFDELRRHSPRFRRAMAMVEAALGASDLDVLRAYIDTLDPGLWLTRSGRARNGARAAELRLAAVQVERLELHPQLVKLYRRLQADFLLLTDRAGTLAGGLSGSLPPERRETLLLLHVLRLTLVHRLYLLAVHVPEFSAHHGLSRDDMVARLLRLDVPAAIATLKEIFPRTDPEQIPEEAMREPSTYRGDAAQSYAREHMSLFDPMLELYRSIVKIGAAISSQIGAVG